MVRTVGDVPVQQVLLVLYQWSLQRKLTGHNDNDSSKCVITDGKCINGCVMKNITITVKRRTQNKKTLLWYDRSKKITKLICVKKKPDRSNLANGG